jgi:hypothetical protein
MRPRFLGHFAELRHKNQKTRCHSVFETHSSSAFFHKRCVATEKTVNFAPFAFPWLVSGSAPTKPTSVTD